MMCSVWCSCNKKSSSGKWAYEVAKVMEMADLRAKDMIFPNVFGTVIEHEECSHFLIQPLPYL